MDDVTFLKEQLTRLRADQTRRRLRAIEGQVRGLTEMVGKNRDPLEILTQVAAVQEALSQVGKLVMRNFVENSVTTALQSESPEEQAVVYDDLMDVIYKFRR